MIRIKFQIAALAGLLSTTSVYAADLAMRPAEPEAPIVTPYDWSGPYLGLHAGYGWGKEDDNQSQLFPEGPGDPGGPGGPGDHFDMDGFLGGAHAGWNYQIDRVVLGIEGDFDYSNLKGNVVGVYNGGLFVRHLDLKTQWQGSGRARIGYAFDNILIYATGGIAFANAELKVNGFADSNTHVGWTAGLGAEYAFTSNWIGRAEVRYSDFSKKSYTTIDGPVKVNWSQTTATLGISYKF